MKHLILCLSAILLLGVASCKTGSFATAGGQQEMCYICLVSSDELANKDVQVKIDDSTQFTAKVQRAKQNTEKHNGKVYGIQPGRRHVEITYKGQVIYSQEIYVTSQQTKTINL